MVMAEARSGRSGALDARDRHRTQLLGESVVDVAVFGLDQFLNQGQASVSASHAVESVTAGVKRSMEILNGATP
jgi:hypothetical protein